MLKTYCSRADSDYEAEECSGPAAHTRLRAAWRDSMSGPPYFVRSSLTDLGTLCPPCVSHGILCMKLALHCHACERNSGELRRAYYVRTVLPGELSYELPQSDRRKDYYTSTLDQLQFMLNRMTAVG